MIELTIHADGNRISIRTSYIIYCKPLIRQKARYDDVIQELGTIINFIDGSSVVVKESYQSVIDLMR